MNRYKFLFLIFVASSANMFAKELFLIDKLESVIYGPQVIDPTTGEFKPAIITKSELDRPSLDGAFKTKDQLILEQLIYQDGIKYNIPDEKMVDSYISALQRQHNITLDDIKKMFKDSGYTYEEGREQLSMINTVNSMLDFKVRSQLIVPEKEAREYYDSHPVYQEEQYKLQRIFFPLSDQDDERKIKKRIAQQIKIGQKIIGADYSDEFWVQEPDLAEDKQFIKKMKIGKTSAPKRYANGFELFKVVDKKEKRLIPFEERYNEIADILRKPLYEKLFEEYKKSLYDDCVIVNFD